MPITTVFATILKTEQRDRDAVPVTGAAFATVKAERLTLSMPTTTASVTGESEKIIRIIGSYLPILEFG
jgi:hypothetical protein